MTSSILRSVRFAFVTLLLGLTTYAVVESFVAGTAVAEGLSTCGVETQPCRLEPLAIVASPAPSGPSVQLAKGVDACGSEETPCVMEAMPAGAARADTRLASTERAVGMTMRVGS